MLDKGNLNKIFGFRSKTGWKSILAIVYLSFCLVFLFFALTARPLVECDGYDLTIYRISSLLIFVFMISPFILLSDTPLRDSLPFFSRHETFSSLLGMMVVFILFILFFIGVESYHTPAYREAFQSYIDTTYEQFYNVGIGE